MGTDFNHAPPPRWAPMPKPEHEDKHTVITGYYNSDILGIKGWVWDDGRIELLCEGGRLTLPAPAKEIYESILARRAAQ